MSQVPTWELAALGLLTLLYGVLSLFRASQVELSRLRLGDVLDEAGRGGGPLARWSAPAARARLVLASQISFQTLLLLVGALASDAAGRMAPQWPGGWRVAAGFGIAAFVLILLVRSIIVRLLAQLAPEKALLWSAPVATVAGTLLMPVLLPLDALAAALRGRLGGGDAAERGEAATEREVKAFVSMGEEEGILEKGEGALVRNVVDTGDTIVREVMTPRTDMVALERGAGLGAARRLFVDSRHSRLPVYSGSVDRIVGVLALKDLLPHWQAADETPVSPLLRPVLHVPETRPVLDLLRDMQRRQAPLAVVVDEYGGTAGLVTIDDLVAEIVGELPEEHGTSEADVVEESPGVWVVSGDTHVDEVRGWLPALIESGDFDTVGGWVSALLGRVPETGERFEHNGLRLEVLAADGRRVRKVRLHGSAASRREEHA